LAGVFDQIRNYYSALQPGQRRIFEAVILMTLAVIVGVGFWSSGEGFQDLYTASDPGDVQAVARELDAQGIPYQVSADGRTLQVRAADEGKARLAGASAGKIIGYEILDGIELGTSPQRERWAYQRSIEGELGRTVSSLEEVAEARVHLSLPERQAFLRDDRPASASVTVRLLPGAVLNKSQKRGIRALVAGAVEGLKPADVVLIDSEGQLLAGGDSEDPAMDAFSSLLAARVAEEERIRRSVMDSLTRVVGSPNDITVGVSVDLETSAVESVERDLDPDAQALVSESIREETSQSTKPSGIPGTASNLPEEEGGGANATTNSSLTEQRSNFDYPRTETRTTRAPGTLKRLSVGVMVNSDAIRTLATAMAKPADGSTPDAAAIEAKDAELRKKIEDTVRVAMGFDTTRLDGLSVSFLPFPEEADPLEGAETAGGPLVSDAMLSWALIALCVILTFVFVIRPFASNVLAAAQPPLPPAIEPGAAGLLDGSLTGGLNRDLEAERRDASKTLTERLRSMVDNFENVDAADLNRLVDLERDATAQVLRRWIRDA